MTAPYISYVAVQYGLMFAHNQCDEPMRPQP